MNARHSWPVPSNDGPISYDSRQKIESTNRSRLRHKCTKLTEFSIRRSNSMVEGPGGAVKLFNQEINSVRKILLLIALLIRPTCGTLNCMEWLILNAYQGRLDGWHMDKLATRALLRFKPDTLRLGFVMANTICRKLYAIAFTRTVHSEENCLPPTGQLLSEFQIPKRPIRKLLSYHNTL